MSNLRYHYMHDAETAARLEEIKSDLAIVDNTLRIVQDRLEYNDAARSISRVNNSLYDVFRANNVERRLRDEQRVLWKRRGELLSELEKFESRSCYVYVGELETALGTKEPHWERVSSTRAHDIEDELRNRNASRRRAYEAAADELQAEHEFKQRHMTQREQRIKFLELCAKSHHDPARIAALYEDLERLRRGKKTWEEWEKPVVDVKNTITYYDSKMSHLLRWVDAQWDQLDFEQHKHKYHAEAAHRLGTCVGSTHKYPDWQTNRKCACGETQLPLTSSTDVDHDARAARFHRWVDKQPRKQHARKWYKLWLGR